MRPEGKRRPEGWKNPHDPVPGVVYADGFDEIAMKAYEAGADAILATIWKMAEESPTRTYTFDASITIEEVAR